MSLCEALQSGRCWTPAVHQDWCERNGKDPRAPITVRAELIRAILFVEGAHLSGCTPPQAECDRLAAYSLNPARRHIAQALVIDWAVQPAQVDHDDVERALEAQKAFDGL
jgi:hypothetical protein